MILEKIKNRLTIIGSVILAIGGIILFFFTFGRIGKPRKQDRQEGTIDVKNPNKDIDATTADSIDADIDELLKP